MALLIRWLFAFVLVVATYNPTMYNYVRWAEANYESRLSLVVLFGLVLFVGYVIFFRATLRSIGAFGVILVVALVAVIVWVLIDIGWLALDNPDQMVWLGVVALSLVLGTGLSWSIIRRRLSGQYDMDDVDEE
ncbi:DUF6524 family protein [Psychromarinibacter sp. C21-152]|uniref:DUF6524 family protein n=1 Tax=Psychromarinibacter sediminicola TaxID=3033385 RepID=A0AAE3NQ44_9RHOB|nr:DUF6524 family protein [Psychromarinibacter sediminicola]MDF0599956.1 DUF6524 family protein [Psychromarinibacter sediminicola]